MADEKKKEPVKYKIGEQEVDLERYIKNIDLNVSEYMKRQNWNEGQRAEFMDAYNQYLGGLKDQLANGTNRFSTDSFGTILDNQGLLSDTDNDNIDPVGSEYYYDDKGNRITTDDYNTLKKRKQDKYSTFSANSQVAKYFDKVGKGLLKKMETEKPSVVENNDFDINKHGFIKWWGDKYNPAGGEYDGTAILELDELVDGKRARTNRSARLVKDFTDYMNNLNDDVDYSKSRFKDKEGYKTFLQNIITKINDGQGLGEDDLLDLGQAGVTREFLNPFLSTDAVVSKTKEEIAAEEAKKKADQEAAERKLREEEMRKFIADQQAIYESNKGNYYDENTASIVAIPDALWMNRDGSVDVEKFLEDNIFKNYKNADIIEQEFLSDPYNSKWNNHRKVFLDQMIKDGVAQQVPEMPGFYYIPRATDRATNTALVYNPTTRQMFTTFIGNTSVWDNIMSNYKREKSWINPEDRYMRKEGGVLRYQYGGFMKSLLQEREQNLEERAKKSGKTVERQEASERYINADNKSFTNPNAGFTGVERARLAAGVADIVSALSAWAPGMGTFVSLGTGLGSTFANLGADVADDSVSAWDTVKNLGLNLGMDLVGLVPGGGAAGKFAKIGKSLKNVVPKVLAALSVGSHAFNTPQYINSWKKLGTDEKLDAQDWNNILASIQGLLGPAAGIGQYAKNKGYYGKNKAEAAKRVDTGTVNKDKVAVKMLDNTGKEKTVLFDGDDAVAIRKAQESGKLKDLKAATVDKFEDLNGWTLKETSFGLRRPKVSLDPTKWSPVGGKTVTPNDLIADVVTRQGVDFARVRGFHDDVTSFHTPGRRWEDIDNAYIETQLQPLASKSAAYDRMLRMKSKAVADYDSKIVTADTNLANVKASGSNKTSAELDAKLQQMRKDKANGVHTTKQDEITSSQNNLVTAQRELASAERRIKRLQKMELAATSETTRTAIRDQIKDTKEVKKAAIAKAESAQKIINDNTKWLADNDDSRVKALEDEYKNIKALEDIVKTLKTDKAKWDKYTDTGKTKLREDFETNYPVDADGNITVQDPNTGRKITRNFKELLDKYKIKHKQGGTLDRVRKFKEAGKITNTTSKANWFTDMFNSPEMTNWLNTFNTDNFENFNNLQRSWATNKANTGYSVGMSHIATPKNQGVWDRQALWNKTGTNAAIERAFSNGKITRAGVSGDNANSGYQDGFFGEQEFLRHGGTKESWIGKKAELEAFQDMLAKKGLTYTLDEKSGMYLMGKLPKEQAASEQPINGQTSPEQPVEQGNPAATTVLKEENSNNSTEPGSYAEGLANGILNDTFYKYSLPRAFYADRVNRRITDMAIDNEKPFLQDPFQVHRTIKSDLDAEAWGQRAAASINNMASRPLTSDGSLQTAAQLDAQVKGQEFINQGNEKSNQALKASQELAWQQEKENAKNRHDVSQQNRLAMLQTMANKGKYEQAYQTKKHEIWDTLIKEKQYREEEKAKKNEAYADAFAKSDISDYVTTNLATLAPGLNEEGIKLYQQVKKGLIAPSSLSSDATKYQLFMEVAEAASKLEQEEYRKYKGISSSRWTPIRQMVSEKNDGINIAKRGTKLRIQNSKVRTKNADRLAKQIKSDLDRNDKALARLSKSIYSYIKGQMV